MTRQDGHGRALRAGALLAAGALALGLAGCGSDHELSLFTPYGAGYSDGCESGYADAGVNYFEYDHNGGLFGSGGYGDGWDNGYEWCQAFWRAADM